MAEMSKELKEALGSDCAHSLEDIMAAKKPGDFSALQGLLTMDPSVDPETRSKALHLLGRWGDPKAVPAIVKILPELDEVGRCRAIDALGRLGTKEGFGAIVDYTNDTSASVRKFVVYALSKDKAAATKKKLKEIEDKDPQPFIRDLARSQRQH